MADRPKFPPGDAIMAGIERRLDEMIAEAEAAEAASDEIKALMSRHIAGLRKMRQQARHWQFFESLDAPHLASLAKGVDFRLLVAVMVEAGPEIRTRWRRALDEAKRQDGGR